MEIVGIDARKAKFDAAVLLGGRIKHATFSNTEARFEHLWIWLAKRRLNPAAPMHACVAATGNWGLELANFLHAQGHVTMLRQQSVGRDAVFDAVGFPGRTLGLPASEGELNTMLGD